MTTINDAAIPAITRDQVQAFGEGVGDFNPVHFDPAFAKAAGLPDTVVHGPLTVALIIDALVAQKGSAALLNADTRLRGPVFPGDSLTVRSAEYGVDVVNQRGELVATTVTIIQGERY